MSENANQPYGIMVEENKVNKAKFIDIVLISRDFVLNASPWREREDITEYLVGWNTYQKKAQKKANCRCWTCFGLM